MKLYTFRLKPGSDLRQEIAQFARLNDVRAGSVVTCVGALGQLTLRMAGATPEKQVKKTFKEAFEIVSLVGTVEIGDMHLHIAVADRAGKVIGGHLKDGTIVDVTAEITLIDYELSSFERVADADTGFDELVVRPRS